MHTQSTNLQQGCQKYMEKRVVSSINGVGKSAFLHAKNEIGPLA